MEFAREIVGATDIRAGKRIPAIAGVGTIRPRASVTWDDRAPVTTPANAGFVRMKVPTRRGENSRRQ